MHEFESVGQEEKEKEEPIVEAILHQSVAHQRGTCLWRGGIVTG